MKIPYRIIENPFDKRYHSIEFHHPIHGKKILGCLSKRELLAGCEKAIFHSFAQNCGCPMDMFDFQRQE